MAAKITRLPQPASHTIEQVFDEFLGDQRRRLRPRTLSKYEDVLGLLRDHLNGYAYQSLSTAEAACSTGTTTHQGTSTWNSANSSGRTRSSRTWGDSSGTS